MFYAIQWLKGFFFEHKVRYILGAALSLLENIMNVIPTYLIGLAINGLEKGTMTMDTIWLYLGIVCITLIISYISEYTWGLCFFGGSTIFQFSIRERIMKHLLGMRAPYYEKFTIGDLMARSTSDVDYASEMLGWGMNIIFSSGTNVIVLLATMLWTTNFFLVLLTLVPYIALLYFSTKVSKTLERKWKTQEDAFSALNDSVLEGVEGVQSIRAYAQDTSFQDRFEKKTEHLRFLNNDLTIFGVMWSGIINLTAPFATLIAFGLGAYYVNIGAMPLGALVSYTIYLTSLRWPVMILGDYIQLLQNANASTKRIDEMLNGTDGVTDGAHKIERIEHIEAKGYSFTYPSSEQVNLDHIDFHLFRGQTLGIVGKTGAGKTTLIRQLLRQYNPGEGRFQVNGIALQDIAKDGFDAVMGYVAQDNALFSGSIFENVSFSVEGATKEDVIEILKQADFDLTSEQMDKGLETLIGENGISLSGGQRQRLCIARALLKDPDLLILDDSLSAVDAKTERTILSNIRESRENKTTIISAHRLSAVEHADLILVFDNGKVVESGTHQALLANGGWYREQFIVQSATNEHEGGLA